MRKHKNKKQQQIMLSFMKQHTDIARGFVKGDKAAQDELWIQLKDELNQAGSPFKETSVWKKTWLDWKNNVRRKFAQNRNDLMITGESNLNSSILSSTDKEIALICGFNTTEDELENTQDFYIKQEDTEQTFISSCYSDAESPPRPSSPHGSSSSSSSAGSPPQPTTSQKRKLGNSNENSAPNSKRTAPNVEELLAEEINSLENISSKIEELAKKKTMKNLEKKFDQIIELKTKKFEEICRHNAVTEEHYRRMEKYAESRLEIKMQEVALKQLDVDALTRSNSIDNNIAPK